MISIHEAPNYGSPEEGDGEAYRRTELRNMRKNTLDLLSQLSTYGIDKYKFRVSSQKGVRSDLGPKMTGHNAASRTRTTVVESSQPVDASANLFYYLFEDYTAPTSFLASSSFTLSELVRGSPKPQPVHLIQIVLTNSLIDQRNPWYNREPLL